MLQLIMAVQYNELCYVSDKIYYVREIDTNYFIKQNIIYF
jgi:hypothetical protein